MNYWKLLFCVCISSSIMSARVQESNDLVLSSVKLPRDKRAILRLPGIRRRLTYAQGTTLLASLAALGITSCDKDMDATSIVVGNLTYLVLNQSVRAFLFRMIEQKTGIQEGESTAVDIPVGLFSSLSPLVLFWLVSLIAIDE